MDLVTIDLETYYSPTYSLTKLSPLEYVRGPEFELICAAIKVNNYPTDVLFGDADIRHALRSIRATLQRGLLVAHNMGGFDSYVLAYVLGVNPRMWGDTLAMARPLHAKTCGLSLAALVKHYGLGVKDNAILVSTRGKHLSDFTPAELEAMATYNKADTDQCHALFHKLRPHYTPAELWQIDALIRMRTEPQFELDVPLLETTAQQERQRKLGALLDLSVRLDLDPCASEDEAAENVRAELASAPRFAALLESLGVDVPMKPSPTNPERQVPALAKTDEAFTALQDHDNELVAAAARARLDVKSTLLETRIQKMLTAARYADGMLPVPLLYCGADTTGRDSGAEWNPQALPRINPDKPRPSDALRNSLRAPQGKLVIVADQSGIELRVNHFLWQVPESMSLFQASPGEADLYRAFASTYYSKAPEDISKPERQFGKVCMLLLQFGGGAETFMGTARIQGNVILDLEESSRAVAAWRRKYAEIAAGWRTCGQALQWIATDKEYPVDPWGMVHTCAEGFVLPSGRLIRYPDLREEDAGTWPDGRAKRTWVYAHGRHKAFVHGAKADENLVQALARDSIFDCSVEYFKRTGLRPALRVHDELVYVVEERHAQDLLDELQTVLRTPPKWWPELVVWSEGDAALTYGAAK